MSQSFSVNGKFYVQSNVLAESLGYTSDYIGKLAREEKILGTLIGRQWFIEPSSLEVYLHKAKTEKEIFKEELSSKRKIEREVHEKTNLPKEEHTSSSLQVLAQAVAVVMCGVFVGGIGFVALGEELGLSELKEGAYSNGASIVSSMRLAGLSRTDEVDARAYVGASAEKLEPPTLSVDAKTEIFTILPLFPFRDDLFVVQSGRSTIGEEFSDEVKVMLDENGNTLVVPIFKHQASSTKRFILKAQSGDGN